MARRPHALHAALRRVVAVVKVESHDMPDQTLLDLPFMPDVGQRVDVRVTALRRYEDFAEDVRKRVGRGAAAVRARAVQ